MKTEPFRFAPVAVRRRFALHPLSFAVCMALSGAALALPQGGTVVTGSATIERPTPKSEVIDQKSDKAIINWRSFSIAGDEKVRFNQPSATSIVLNRVTGYDPSYILGQMSSNGRIFLVNPYGVVFGAGARVDVGGLVVSTLSIADNDFLASRYNLTSVDPAAPAQRGAIRNEGTISAPGGLVVLAGPTVTNTGTIVANGGRVGLVAANSVSVDVEGDGLIFFQANATDAKNRLEQLGRIQADGGTVEMRAAARGAFADTVLNMAGVVQARSIGTREGKVVIDGGGDGITTVSGKIDATGLAAGERGGEATIQGQRVLIDNGAVVDVSGSSGGGLIRVGGDFHGANPDVRNAEYTGVAPTAQLHADAVDNGDGGKIAVWSDKITRYDGSISAQGGKQGGDGGFVEVSGKEQLAFRGNVSTLAPKGKPGTLLLDPADILITDNTASPDDGQLDPNVPTALDPAGLIRSSDPGTTFTLSSTKLEAIGNSNAIDLQATNSIVINDLVTNVTTTKTLTLNGGNASFSAGNGGISMATDNTIKVTNGSLTMDSTAFGAGAVVAGTLIAKNGITLAGTTVTLNGPLTVTAAGKAVSVTGATTLAAGSGTVTLTGNNPGNNVTFGTVDGAQTLAITATGGDIVLGTVGGTTALTGVTLAGNTASFGAVTTSGAQDYSGVATTTLNGTLTVNTAGAGVIAGATLLAAGGGTIALTGSNAANDVTLGAVDGGQALAVTAGGGDIVLGAVGGTTPLAGVTLAGNTASLQAVTTSGAQDYSGVAATTLHGTLTVNTAAAGVSAGATTLAAGSGAITLSGNNAANDVTLGTVDGGHALNITATGGDIVLGAVGGTTPLTGVTLASNTASLGAVTTTGAQDYSGVATTTLKGTLTVNTAGAGVVAGTTVLGAGGGTITLSGNNAANDVTLGTVDGAHALNITATGGDVVLDTVGATTPLTSVAIASNTASLQAVTTSGAQDYSGVTTTTLNGTLTVNTAGAGVSAGTTTLAAGSGTIALTGSNAANDVTLGAVDGGQALAVTAGGGDIVLGAVGGTTPLAGVTLAGNTASLQAVTTSGAQDYSGVAATTLHGTLTVNTAAAGVSAGATTLAAGSGAITLSGNNAANDVTLGTVDGGHALNITATGGDIVLGAVGGTTPLTGVTLASNTASLGAVTTTGAQDYSGVATTTLKGTLTVNTAGAGVVAGTTVLGAGGGTITLSGNNAANDVTLGTVDGAHALNITATGGDVVLGTVGATTPLTSVAIASNTAGIQDVTTNGAQNYNAKVSAGAVSLNAGSGTITATNANNDFTGTLTLTGGATQITDTNALTLGTLATGALTATSTGPLNLGSGSASSIVAVSNGGAVSQAGALTVSGTTIVNAGANTITLANPGNDFTGAVGLTTTGVNNATVKDTNALVLGASSVGGNLDVTAKGDISQTGALVVTGTSNFTVDTAVAANVLLSTNANNFTGAVTIATTGGASLNDVGLRNDSLTPALPTLSLAGLHSLDLQFTNAAITVPTVSLTGSLNVVAGGDITQQAGGVQVVGTSSFSAGAHAITLLDPLNNFGGAVSVTNSGANNVSLRDANAIVLGASNLAGSGALAVTAGGDISETAPLLVGGTSTFTVTAAGSNVALSTANNNFAGTVTVATAGAGTVNDLGLRNVSLSAAVPALPANLHNLDLQFTAAAISVPSVSLSGTLNVVAGGDITQQAGGVQVVGTSSFSAGAHAITLLDPLNDFGGAVSVTNAGANNVSLRDASAIVLGASNVGSGTFSVTAAGPITQAGAIVQAPGAGAASFNAGANAITVADPGNDFTGAVSVTNSGANNVSLRDANALVLGASNVGSGTFSVTAAGPITQAGAIVQAPGAGAASFNAGANAITVADPGNDFTGAVSVTNSGANNVSLRDASALVLGASNVGSGTFSVTAAGPITQAGAIVQAPGAGAASFNAGANAITVADPGNDFTGAVSVTNSGANNVSLRDASALVLGASNVGSGTFSVTAAGPITQAGAIVQAPGAGAASFNAGANAITVADPGNDFTGAVSVTNSGANNVSLRDANALIVGASNVGSGTLAVTAGGPITEAGPIAQAAAAGAATFNAGANTITLANPGNDFTGAVGLTTTGVNNATVKDTNALVLGASSVGGNLDVTAKGDISQTGALVVTGTSNFTVDTAVAANVLLSTNANNFTGAVTIATTGGASLNDVGLRNDSLTPALPTLSLAGLHSLDLQFTNAAITVPTVSLTGSLNVVAGGDITQQAGGVQVVGTSSFSAGAHAITLLDPLNNFGGAVSVTNSGANNVSLRDANAIVLGASNVGTGTLAVTAGGAITQTGAVVQVAGAAGAGFNAGANAITLTNAGNDFTGAVALTGATVQVTDANALTLGAIATGALTATSSGALNLGSGSASSIVADSNGGAVSQTGALVVAGATNVNAGANTITLNTVGNDFGSFGATGGAVTVRDLNALALDAINATGLTVSAGGNVTQNAAAVVTGATVANAGASAITLGNAGNNFGSVGATGGAVTITDVNALALDAVNATSLTVNTGAGNGAVTQNAAAVVTGATTVAAGSGAITLANAGNNFGSVAATGGAVSITDVNALVLGAVTATSLNVNTSAGNGAVTQTGAAVVSGATNVNAGTGAVALTNPGNDFATLGVTGGATSIVDNNALSVTSLTSAANQAVTITAGGALTLPASAIATGTADLTISSVGTLTTAGTLSGNNVAMTSTGAMTINNSVTAQGTLALVTTNAPITQTAGAIVATGSTTVTAGSGDVSLARAGNDFSQLSLTGGALTVADANSLDVTALTSGLNRPVSITANGALTLPLSGSIATGTADLTLAANTLTVTIPLSGNNVALTGTTALNLGAGVTSTGTQTYATPVALIGNVALDAGTSKIDLQGGVVGNGHDLTLASSNTAADAIHARAPIGTVGTLAVDGNSTLNGSVTSNGNQTYTGLVTLENGSVALNANAGKIDLAAGVDGQGQSLSLSSTASAADAVRADAAIGNAAALTITGKSTLASGVTTTGTQTYTDTVTIAGTASFSGSALAFGNGLVAGGSDLTLRSDSLSLAGTISGSGNATLATQSSATTIGLAGGAGTYQLDQATIDKFGGFATLTIGRSDGTGDIHAGNLVLPTQTTVQSASGNATFAAIDSAAGQARNLSVSTGGATTFSGAIGGAIGSPQTLGTLTVAGNTVLDASTNTSGAQNFGGAVAVGADATMSATAVSFGAGLDVATHSLTLLTDALSIAGGATGSGAGNVRVAPNGAAGSLGVAGAPGTLQLSQSLVDTLSGIPTLTVGRNDGSGAIAIANLGLRNDLAVASGSSAVSFTGTLDSAGAARNVSVTTTGLTSFGGTVGAAQPLAGLTVAGPAQLGGNVTTTGAQSYGGATTLAADSTVSAGAGSVTFGGSVDGAHALAVNATTTVFAGTVGATAPLASLTTDVAGTTQLGGNVTTSGAQTYNDALRLNADASLAGGTLTLAGSVDGAHTLAVNGATQVTLGGPIGATTPLAALSTSGPLLLGAGQVTTTGTQSFAGATTLGAATTLAGSAISFGGAVDGPFDLTLQSAGATSFSGSVGATTPLASLIALGGGPVALSGAAISTSGAQNYSGALQLAGTTQLTASSLTLAGPVSGATDLTLQTNALAGATSLSGTGILSIVPNDPTISLGVAGGAGALQIAQAVLDGAIGFTVHVIGRTDGSGTISAGNLVLRADTTLQTASGDIALGGSVDGAFALNLNSGATTSIAGPIGATTPLKSLTTDNNPNATDGTTAGTERTVLLGDASGTARITTTGAQTYNDPIVASVPVSFAGTAIVANQPLNQLAADASATPAPNVLANTDTLQLHSTNDIRLGNTTLGNGGDIESDAALHLAGTIQLNGGTLLLVAKGNSGTVPLSSELTGKSVNSQTTLESAATIVQDSGTISSAAGSLLSLKATGSGSIDVQQAGNNLLGKISAVSGTSGDNDVTRFQSPPVILSFIRLASTQINVAGAPPNDAAAAGIEADVVRLKADTLTTGPDGLIRARLPFNNLVGSNASIPGITFELTPTTLAGLGNFGTTTPDGFVQIRVGAADGGFITARPNGVSGDNAVIFLGGPADVRPFYDGNGKLTEIRVFYNGDAPRTPQEAGALAAVIALIEDARHQRFEEAVRTENVTSRLRSGVIAEVGAGRPATVGRESIKLPEICDVKAGTLRCE